MATLDEIKLAELLQPFQGPGGIASLNPLAFQYQDQFYPNQMQYQYPPRTDISPTQDFYQLNSISPTQDFYQPRTDISPTQDFYPSRTDISPTQDFYPERNFVNAPQNFYPPDLTTLRGLDMNKFQGVSDMSVIDETTNDEQDQEYIDQVEKSNNPLKGIINLLRNIPTPFNLARRGLESLRGLNDRIQSSDFGQATSLMDYLDMKKYGGLQGRKDAAARTMAQARGITKSLASRPSSTSGGYQQGPGGSGAQSTGASRSQSQAGPGFSGSGSAAEMGSF
jgi:hypothetical protein